MLQTIYFIIFIKHLVTVITCIDSWVCVCSGSDDSETLQAQKNWKKSIMLVWRAAANHKLVQFISLEDTVSPLARIAVIYHFLIHFFHPPSPHPPSPHPPSPHPFQFWPLATKHQVFVRPTLNWGNV